MIISRVIRLRFKLVKKYKKKALKKQAKKEKQARVNKDTDKASPRMQITNSPKNSALSPKQS